MNESESVNAYKNIVHMIDLTEEKEVETAVEMSDVKQENNESQFATNNAVQSIESLRSQLDNLKRENKILHKEKLECKAKLRRVNLKNTNSQNETSQLREHNERLAEDITNLKSIETNFKLELDSILTIMQQQPNENSELNDELTRLKHEIEVFVSNLNELLNEIETKTEMEMCEMDSSLNLSERALVRVKQIVMDLNQVKTTAKKHVERISVLEEQEEKTNKKISILNEKIDRLKTDYNEMRKRKQDLSVSYNKEKKESTRLNNIVTHYKIKITNLYDRIKLKDTSLGNKKDEVNMMQKEKDELLRQLIDKQNDLENSRTEIKVLKRKIEEDDECMEEDKELYEENYTLKRKLKESEIEVKNLKEAYILDEELRLRSLKEHELYKKEVESKNKVNEMTLTRLNETIERLNKENDYLRNDNSSHLKELSQLNESNEFKLNETIARLNKEVEFWKNDAQLKRGELDQTNHLKEMELNETINNLTRECSRLQKQLDERDPIDKIEIKSLREEVISLREDIDKKTYVLNSLSQKKNDYMVQLKREQEVSNSLRLKLQKFDKLVKETCTRLLDTNE